MALLFLFLLAVSPNSLWALDRVECWDKDCLAKGWTLLGMDRKGYTDYQCREGDCQSQGWITGGSFGVEIYTACKEQNCFKSGWYEIQRSTQALLANVVCRNADCLVYGWDAYSPQGTSTTRCLNEDCRHYGWRTIHPGHKTESVNCIANDCFHSGWYVSR